MLDHQKSIRKFIDFLGSQSVKFIVFLAQLFLIIFLGYLFNIDWQYSLYLGGLCFFVLLIEFIYSFERECKIIEDLERNILPNSLKGYETYFSDKLRDARETVNKLEQESTKRLHDMTNFYTLWVHQIKTPIAALRLLVDEYEKGNTHLLQSEVIKIEQYIDLLMAYFRLGDDFTDYHFEKLNSDELIKKSIRKFSNLFILKGIKLDYKSDAFELITDGKWFSLMLDQLLSNAIKYTAEGVVRIYWEHHTLIIEDTGVGIPQEDLPRITEKGYTGYNGRVFSNTTGVGLFIAKTVSEKLNASLTIDSEVGKGTKVSIKFKNDKHVIIG